MPPVVRLIPQGDPAESRNAGIDALPGSLNSVAARRSGFSGCEKEYSEYNRRPQDRAIQKYLHAK
jgi:hypothetical protein